MKMAPTAEYMRTVPLSTGSDNLVQLNWEIRPVTRIANGPQKKLNAVK